MRQLASALRYTGLVGLLGACAVASHAALPLEGSVYEDLARGRYRPQSGLGTFVGIVQGPMQAAPDLARLRAVLPGKPGKRRICFWATTFDSVYSAIGGFRAPADAGQAEIGVKGFSQHTAAVKQYAADELAVVFSLSADCELESPKSMLVMAATFNGPMEIIRVALNTKHPKPALELKAEGGQFDGVCRAMGARATAYQQLCEFRVDPSAFRGKPATLTLRKESARKAGKSPGQDESVLVFFAPRAE